MWWRNYSQNLFQKIETEHISGSTVQILIQFDFTENKVQSTCFYIIETFFKKHKEVWN